MEFIARSAVRPGDVIPEGQVWWSNGDSACVGRSKMVVLPNPVSLTEHRPLRGEELSHEHLGMALGFTLGADPEVFVVGENGLVIPAWEFLPDKKQPRKFSTGAAFYDGFQAEMTVTATGCLGFLTDHVRFGLKEILNAARTKNPKAKLVIDGMVPVSKEVRDNTPPEHLQLGCSPSRSAYGEPALVVPNPEDLDVRFAGSHMHFGLETLPYNGYTPDHVDRIVRFLDASFGCMCVSFAEGYEQPGRRKYYGRAGEYRWAPGFRKLEYRVPGPTLTAHPATFNLLWEFARGLVRLGIMGMEDVWVADPDEVRQAINESNVGLARTILDRNHNVMEQVIRKVQRTQAPYWFCGDEWTSVGLRVVMNGIGSVVREPTNVEGNWWLGAEYDQAYDVGNKNQKSWWGESYNRAHKHWPSGRIWSSAAKVVEEGGMV